MAAMMLWGGEVNERTGETESYLDSLGKFSGHIGLVDERPVSINMDVAI